jgi:hypothetical protein
MPSPSPLTRRPQATALSIEDLLDLVRRGEVRVPEFQRSLQWKAKDVRDLLDSIYRGYPIGTLLFWKKEAPAASVRFGPVTIDAPQASQALWVVDGQQRTTSLAGVLLHPPYPERAHGDFVLYFDLEKEEFVRPRGGDKPLRHWLPMNAVLDSELLLGWLDRYPGRAEHPGHTRAAMRLGKAIREYQVPAYIVEADEEQTLRTIFGRLNSAGRPLKQADVFNALHGGSKGHPSDLHELSRSLLDLGFGVIEPEWLLKAVLAVRGFDITRRFERILKEDGTLADALEQTTRALRGVIVFIKRDAGIPHVELLPYKLPLALLARFFHLHPQPSPRSRELLTRWIWRGAILGLHRGERISVVRDSLAAIGPDEEHSVQALLAKTHSTAVLNTGTGGFFIPSAMELQPYNFRTAHTKLEVNALLALQPRDLRTGDKLDGPKLIEQRGAEALLRIFNARSDGLSAQHNFTNLICNRLIHPPVEEHSLQAILREAADKPELLASHGIPPEAVASLHTEKSLEFLQERSRFLRQRIRLFLDTKARWKESDRASIRSLIVLDEEA